MRQPYFLFHLSNGFDSKDQFISVIARVELPWPRLVAATDHAAVKNARTISAIEEKSRKSNAEIVVILRVCKNPLLAIPRSDRKTGIFDTPTKLVRITKNAFPK